MTDPGAAPIELVTILVAVALMLYAGVGKRQLDWRPRPPRPRRRTLRRDRGHARDA